MNEKHKKLLSLKKTDERKPRLKESIKMSRISILYNPVF
jgi:hypothetical protein